MCSNPISQCAGVIGTRMNVSYLMSKETFALKAVSPFIAHRAATIPIPLSSFFKDKIGQLKTVSLLTNGEV